MSTAAAPTPRRRALDLARADHPLHVDGTASPGGGAPARVHDPSTGTVLAEVATADVHDVDTAVRAARRAHDRAWSRIPGGQRGEALLRVARGVPARAEELAALESLGTGIPLRQTCERDIPAVLAHLVHQAGWADKLAHAGYGPGPEGTGPRARGVVAVVVPATSPLVPAVRVLAAALATGNAVVLVPSSASPLAALALAEVAREADLPPGLLTVLPGASTVRSALAAHTGVSSVTVVGSPAEAALVQRQLAGHPTRLALELGGAATTLVLADAEPIRAAAGLAESVTAHHQLCGAGSRVLVHRAVAQALVDELRARLARLRVGDALDPATDVGPLPTAQQRSSTEEQLSDGSGSLWRSPAPVPTDGWFLPPAVRTATAGPVAAPDPAGPVLTVQVIDSADEMGAAVHAQPSGLGLGVWTDDPERVAALARRWRRDVVHDGCPVPTLGHGGGPASLEGYLDVR